MNKEQTDSGNITIARYISDEPEVLEKDLQRAGTVESMQYHNQWDWIMPVIEKISQEPTVRKIEIVFDKGCKIYNDKGLYIINKCSKKVDTLMAIWLSCIEFSLLLEEDKMVSFTILEIENPNKKPKDK